MKDFLGDDEGKRKDLEKLKRSLRDIAPVRDKLSQVRDGDRSLNDLLKDSTFQARVKDSLGDLSKREKKEVIRDLLNELD